MNRSIKFLLPVALLLVMFVPALFIPAQITPPPGGGGSGTVTSVTFAGTANQITVTGSCTGTTTISCTLSIPSGFVLPGTIDGLTITTTTGTLTIASAKVLSVSNSLTLAGTDGVTLTFPATNATIARTDAAQTFTGTQTFTSPIVGSALFANAALKGSVISAFLNNGGINNATIGGTQIVLCGRSYYFPAAGYLRRATVTTRFSNNGSFPLQANVVTDCGAGAAGFPLNGGIWTVAPAATAGLAYSDTFAGDFYHVQQGSTTGLGSRTVGNETLNGVSMEFVGDGADYPSILAAAMTATSLTASSTLFNGFFTSSAGFQQSTELNAGIPIPFAATASNLNTCEHTGTTSSATTFTLRVNSASPASGPAVTVPSSDVGPSCYQDLTHTAALAAGDYVDVQQVTGSATTPTLNNYSIVIKPTSGTSTFIGGMIGATVTTTTTFYPFGAATSSTTATSAAMGMPNAYTLSNLYVLQAAANGGGVTTTCSIYKNGSITAVTGTITSGSGTGAILVDGTHTVSFAQGDTMELGCSTASGTSGAMGGWSAALV